MAVFAVQRDRAKDFGDADRFGSPLIFLLGRSFFPDTSYEDVQRARVMIAAGLEQFQADRDFVLLNGDPVAVALVTSQLTRQGVKVVKFLKWDRENSAYYPVEVVL